MPFPCAWGHGPVVRRGRAGPGRAGSSSPPLPSAPLPPPRTRAAVPRATPPVPPRVLLPGRPAPLGPAAPFLNGSRPGAAGCRGSPAGAAGKVTETVTVTQRPRNGCGLRFLTRALPAWAQQGGCCRVCLQGPRRARRLR